MRSSKQLRHYLAYTIHGRTTPPETPAKTPPRKPPAKAKRAGTRRGPERSPAFLAFVRTQPSIVSGRGPCDAAHTGSDGGMAQKASDFSCVPLTRAEHEEYHRIGRDAFAARYGVDFAAECARLRAAFERMKAA